MDLKNLQEQAKIAHEAIKQIGVQQRNLQSYIEIELKKATEESKKEVEELQNTMREVMILTEKGQFMEAQNLIKHFIDGSKNSK